LHDLRHGAAILVPAADIDTKILSDTLGHSDTRITRDIYQSVVPQVGKGAAGKPKNKAKARAEAKRWKPEK
jgi:integrase